MLGGQLAINVLAIYGRQQATIGAHVTGSLGPIGFATDRSVSQSLGAWGDVFVQPTLRWNQGANNYMVYAMANIPVGAYDSTRLVNLGLGHWAVDAGAGYTYFNPQTGNEFSAVTGFTYNFKNPSLDYQNGIDWHLDLAASHFVTKQVFIGAVGYAYQQITGDSGAGATLGDFKSRVFGAACRPSPAEADARQNWLPAPADQFALIVRAYVPTQRILDSGYKLPNVERVNGR